LVCAGWDQAGGGACFCPSFPAAVRRGVKAGATRLCSHPLPRYPCPIDSFAGRAPLLRLSAPQLQLLSQESPPAEPAEAVPAGDADEQQQQEQQQQQQQAASPAAATLRDLVSEAPPEALAAAFNALELEQRRALLAAAPEARIPLNVRGIDLKAAVASSADVAVSSIGDGDDGDSTRGRGQATDLQQLPDWPGQAPRLVDAFGFQDIPGRLVARALAAAAPLEAAAAALDLLLGAAAGGRVGEGDGEGELAAAAAAAARPAGATSGDIAFVREAAAAYSTLLWAYDKVGSFEACPRVQKIRMSPDCVTSRDVMCPT
jgi:hypothetical protein